MSTNFFDLNVNDPIAALPPEPLERAMSLRNGLVALCEGRGAMDELVYRTLRREFMADPATSNLVPQFVRTAQDTGAMWACLKNQSGQWEPRRQFVRNQFAPLIDRLERGGVLADAVISDAVVTFDAAGISEAWNKALARREVDPAGAITAARTLLESVCKHLLEDEAGKATYGANDDLSQDRYNLLLGKPAALHRRPPSRRTLAQIGGVSGEHVTASQPRNLALSFTCGIA